MDFVIDNDNDHGRMNEVDWKKDGETGCLMAVVKFGALAVVTAAAMFTAAFYAVPAVEALWR